MKILFLSRWYPYPPNNGSKLRINNLLKGLCEHHDVSLLSFAEPSEITPDMERPLSNFREINIIPRKPFDPLSRKSRAGFFSATPRSFIDTFSPELANNIEQILNSEKFDLVLASQVDMAAYGRYFQQLPAIFEEAEVGVLYEQYKNATSFSQKLRYWLTWNKHKRFLASTLKYFKAATVVSQKERELLSQAVSNHPIIQVIPNGVDTKSYRDVQEIQKPNTMIFTGVFNGRNFFNECNRPPTSNTRRLLGLPLIIRSATKWCLLNTSKSNSEMENFSEKNFAMISVKIFLKK